VISTYSTGTDHIDLNAAREKGLRVTNTPHTVTVPTAEIAML
jgi:lactate dehydrogenase-like 2-hydroxyacid dehydrogenase